MALLMNVADLVCPDDPQQRTYRQINAAKIHTIPIGTLVGLENGVRLFVVAHHRDCDETPLYALSWDVNTELYEYRNGIRFWRRQVHHGNPEWCLSLVTVA